MQISVGDPRSIRMTKLHQFYKEKAQVNKQTIDKLRRSKGYNLPARLPPRSGQKQKGGQQNKSGK